MSNQLAIYNTMSARKERFEPMRQGEVSMFVCGPTVQGLMHMGHARTYIFYDLVARYLSHLGNRVKFIVNITDVDERISQLAQREGQSPMTVARRYERFFLEDMRRLKIDTVTSFERVSDYVPAAIRQVSVLMDKGYAYSVDGWVYFDTSSFRDFGKLSHLSKRELALRPLELSLKKKHLLDFSLWRPMMLVKGKWTSPWGMGSPGWHIQDTAITISKFGPQYDIHGGAYELIYPHHEAEIAQGESITGLKPLVKYWVHTKLVNTDGEKMSKSAGNIYAVRDALKRFDANEVRFSMLKHHYRDDIGLEDFESGVREYRSLRSRVNRINVSATHRARTGTDSGFLSPFYSAMNDDFDTPAVTQWLESTVESLEGSNQRQLALRLNSLAAVSEVLGLDFLDKP